MSDASVNSPGVSITRGTSTKPASSESLIEALRETEEVTGQLFVGYPIISSPDGRQSIDAVFVSPSIGLVVIDLIEGSELHGHQERQDDMATRLESKLLGHRDLVSRRKLRVPVLAMSYAPKLRTSEMPNDPEYPVATASTVVQQLAELGWPDAEPEIYKRTLSALQSISSIRRTRTPRSVQKTNSLGSRLATLEESIATLDSLQSRAVIETVEGVQRIRGLAGSGKTIVLALKTAYLHAQHPDWKIGVTFQTRSLRAQFIKLITSFTFEQTGEEPDWSNVQVMQAWGAGGGGNREGVYHKFCTENGVDYLDFNSAKNAYGTQNAFRGACAAALAAAPSPRASFDAILVDEAQDFPADFLKLVYQMLKPSKRLVYAYDELQNLSEAGVGSPEEIFGVDDRGRPLVNLSSPDGSGARSDIILEKCYRNSRPVLVTAHALGFGTYRKPVKPGRPGLVQMFSTPSLWEDIGYRLIDGELRAGSDVRLTRTEETSPTFLEDHSSIDDLVSFQAFASASEQTRWLADAIQRNLEHDELRHDDIVIINPDPFSTRRNMAPIRSELLLRGINSHLAGVDAGPDVFFQPDGQSITCTGIYRAKGNEAGMIYVINADESFEATSMATTRNRLFTAITRSKAWVRVLGVGEAMEGLKLEFRSTKEANFQLDFTYPTPEEQEHMQVVHRDMSAAEAKAVARQQASLEQLVSNLQEGRVLPEDLDESMLATLTELLEKRRGG